MSNTPNNVDPSNGKNPKSTKARKPKAFTMQKATMRSTKIDNKNSENKASKRKPRAINADSKKHIIEMLPDSAVDDNIADIKSLTPPEKLEAPKTEKRFSWFKVLAWALTTLIALGVGLYIDQLIRELFARHEWLGYLASGVTALFIISIIALLIREIFSFKRMRSVSSLRVKGDKARKDNDLKLARIVAIDISNLLSSRPETAKGRADIQQHLDSVMDGKDLIHLVEKDILAPLDKTAQKMVMASAKRISIVTAVSPRALVDIGFVLYENTRLIRAICELYGGKPSSLGFWKLAKKVISHLAATGAIAIGDGLLQQFIGQGVASKLSARLGEGVVNGLLCARIGISAIDICRPLAFDAEKRPGVSDFLSALTKLNSSKHDEN